MNTTPATKVRYYTRELAGRNLAPGTAAHTAHRAELAAIVDEAHTEANVDRILRSLAR